MYRVENEEVKSRKGRNLTFDYGVSHMETDTCGCTPNA